MIYFTINEQKMLKGVARNRLNSLSQREIDNLLTDEKTTAIIEPSNSWNSSVMVQVSEFNGEDFRVAMKVSDYVTMSCSKLWVDGRYNGPVRLIKHGMETFIKTEE